MNWRRFISVLISAGVGIAAWSVAPSNASAAVILTSNTGVSYGSGNVTKGSDGANGIPLPHLSIPFNAQVGDVIEFTVETEARTNGELAPITVSTNPLVLDNAVSSAKAAVGLAFGSTSLTAGVTLNSEEYAGAFPSSASANAINAAAGLPDIVPEPAILSLLAIGGLSVFGKRRKK
jgi:hypothetical protein